MMAAATRLDTMNIHGKGCCACAQEALATAHMPPGRCPCRLGRRGRAAPQVAPRVDNKAALHKQRGACAARAGGSRRQRVGAHAGRQRGDGRGRQRRHSEAAGGVPAPGCRKLARLRRGCLCLYIELCKHLFHRSVL